MSPNTLLRFYFLRNYTKLSTFNLFLIYIFTDLEQWLSSGLGSFLMLRDLGVGSVGIMLSSGLGSFWICRDLGVGSVKIIDLPGTKIRSLSLDRIHNIVTRPRATAILLCFVYAIRHANVHLLWFRDNIVFNFNLVDIFRELSGERNNNTCYQMYSVSVFVCSILNVHFVNKRFKINSFCCLHLYVTFITSKVSVFQTYEHS